MAKNIIIGQSGGPTAVINSSLAGVYKAARSLGADKVYGMKYGIEGLLKEELLELNVLLDDRMSIELLKRTPSSYLGSCRFKLPDPDTDATPFVKLFTLFDKYDICAVFYIGGNDSMDTIAKLSRYGQQVGSNVRFIGVPKTIDNDLCLTDHTPGYGSAAKYIATILKEVIRDSSVYNIRSVTVAEIMGRHAGWLAGAACLAGGEDCEGPDLILLPGTKNTIDDLLWLRQSGLEPALLKLAARGTPVFGVCGGYQMLGETLADPMGSESGRPQTLRGLGLLPTRTVFTAQKRRTQTHATAAAGPFAGAALTGYEIHTGRTEVQGLPFCTQADGHPEGCVQGDVFGTYLHGLFDTGELTEKLVEFLCKRKGIRPESAALIPMEQYRQQQFDRLADGVRSALDLDALYAAMGLNGRSRT